MNAGLTRTQRRQRERMLKSIRREISIHGMECLLNRMFGRGGWSYDEQEELYIVRDYKDGGPGRAFYCIKPDGDWFKARLPDLEVQ